MTNILRLIITAILIYAIFTHEGKYSACAIAIMVITSEYRSWVLYKRIYLWEICTEAHGKAILTIAQRVGALPKEDDA